MSAPIIKTIIPFDSISEYILNFSYTGFQVRKNKVIIKNNESNTIVYEKEVTSTLLKHQIPANILTNGTTYNIQVQVYDIDNNASPLSNIVVFTCLSTPLFTFANLNNDDVIKESYINLQMNYNQADGELLNTYIIQLFNFSKQLVYSSDTKNSNDLTTMITGLEENSQYYIRAIGETVNHISLDTGYVSFLCKYLKPSTFSYIELKNNRKEASVSVSSNIISIEGVVNGTPIYIDGKMLDLTADGVTALFNEAFNLQGDFTLHIQGKNFANYKDFLIAKDKAKSGEIRLSWWTYLNSETRLPEKSASKLEVDGTLGVYTLHSDRISVPNPNDIIHIWLRRVGNLYELKIANKGGV